MMSMKKMKPKKNGFTKQGYYELINPKKYASPVKIVIYRSMLEKRFFRVCDTSREIKKWISEPDEITIMYHHPFKKRMSRYFIDVYLELATGEKFLCEVKPSSLTLNRKKIKGRWQYELPKKPSKNAGIKAHKNYIKKIQTITVNTAKEKAAKEFGRKHGMKFVYITEQFIDSFK